MIKGYPTLIIFVVLAIFMLVANLSSPTVSNYEYYHNYTLAGSNIRDDISFGTPLSVSALHYPLRHLNCAAPTSRRYLSNLPPSVVALRRSWCPSWRNV